MMRILYSNNYIQDNILKIELNDLIDRTTNHQISMNHDRTNIIKKFHQNNIRSDF
jgi:hypothetical protein